MSHNYLNNGDCNPEDGKLVCTTYYRASGLIMSFSLNCPQTSSSAACISLQYNWKLSAGVGFGSGTETKWALAIEEIYGS